ncbi:neurocan core protein-like [Patiria miniata]|uniref:C-type lectin domain-containing protein n=1 Tax=Patiria miniata TaxID=46514 RepID=A0A914AGC1_PATMI|nr:neurocan core protein-like [Patiria miniata]
MALSSALLCAITFYAAAVQCTKGEGCDEGWIPFREFCFFPGAASLSWSDARQDCRQRGGDLAVITDKPTNDFVKQNRASSAHNWIGLHDPRPDLAPTDERQFVWTDGKSPDYYGFSKWKTGQPNNADGNEDCVVFVRTGDWVDKPCHLLKLYVCQRLVDMTSTVSTEETYERTDEPGTTSSGYNTYVTDGDYRGTQQATRAPGYHTHPPPRGTDANRYTTFAQAGCRLPQVDCYHTGDCISELLWCNGRRDCPNGEDEANCAGDETFQCADGTTHPRRKLCDRFTDCRHAEDELYCV